MPLALTQQSILESEAISSSLLHPATGARILFLMDEMAALTAGGTERQILQMVDICKNGGMSPHLCFLRRTTWLTPQQAGCPILHLDIDQISSFSGLRKLARLARWMRRQRFHILQTFFSDSNLVGPFLGRLARIPIVLGTRRNLNHAHNESQNFRLLRAQGWSNRLVDHIIANSNAVLERIIESENLPGNKICVVYNGIDLEQMRPRPDLRERTRRSLGLADDQLLVGNISGLRRIKGVHMFINAAAEAARRDPRLRFLLVGDGDLKTELLQTIRILGMQKIICLAGAADDVRPYLAAFDIGVLCSHAEGFSNSLLEYMASGVPAIATDVGGNREALGSCGLLIRPEAQALANAIHIMSDARVRNELSAAALDRVRTFDLDIASRRLLALYAQFLNKAGFTKAALVQPVAHPAPRSLKISGT